MYKLFQHIIAILMMLGIINKVSAQIAMPDTVCVGTSRVYKVNDAIVLSTYTWKIDGVTQSSTKNDISITWNTAGTFLLSVQEHVLNGCDGDIRSGLVYVNPLPVPNAGPDVSICFGDVVRLNGSGGAVYQWSPPNYLSNTNTANPLVTLPLAGTYRYILSVSNKGCQSIAKDTVIITMRPPVKVFAGNDTLVTISQPLQLNAVDVNNSSFINYIWSPPLGLSNTQIKNPVAILNNNITYTVTAKTIDGCTAKDDIVIKVFAAPEIYVPNAFTPNNDGQNDVLRPILTGIRQLKYFAVYNRYGQEIYRTSVHGQGWNGLVKGVMQNTGAFVWIAEAVDYKGNILKREGMAVLVK